MVMQGKKPKVVVQQKWRTVPALAYREEELWTACVVIPASGRDGKWMRPLSPCTEPTFYPCSFSPPTFTPSQCTQLPLHRCRVSTALYTIEPKRKRGTTAIAYFLYRLAARCSVQCARKYRQLRNLSVVLIIFAKKKKQQKMGGQSKLRSE